MYSDQQLIRIKNLSDDDLVKNAQSEDLASIVESNRRLKGSTERLTWVLIILTLAIVVLTAPLALEAIIKFYHQGFY